jgi:hypothetical protein
MAQQRSRRGRGSSKSASRGGSRTKASGSAARPSEGKTDPQLHGREPGHEPDVFVDIHKVKVDEVYVDVEQLEAHLALRAKLANLLQVVAGVHVHLGKVVVDIKGVEAQARLKVRLENLYDILDRALTTLDKNPQILESLVKTVDDTLGSVGELGQKALGPGGAVSETLGGVGQAAQQAVQPGGAAGEALGGVSNAAGQALGSGGAVGQLGQGLGQGAGQLGQGIGQGVGDVGNGLGQAAGQASSGLGRSARAIVSLAKTAASELVPDLVERVKEVAGGDDDILEGNAAHGKHQPLLDADELEQNRRARAERRQRRRELRGASEGRGAAPTGTAPKGRTGESRGSERKRTPRRGKRGSKRGSARSTSTSNRAKSS